MSQIMIPIDESDQHVVRLRVQLSPPLDRQSVFEVREYGPDMMRLVVWIEEWQGRGEVLGNVEVDADAAKGLILQLEALLAGLEPPCHLLHPEWRVDLVDSRGEEKTLWYLGKAHRRFVELFFPFVCNACSHEAVTAHLRDELCVPVDRQDERP